MSKLKSDVQDLDGAESSLLSKREPLRRAIISVRDVLGRGDLHSTFLRKLLEEQLSRDNDQMWAIDDSLKKLRAAREKLQKVCLHPEVVFDHFEPHNREDFHRCTSCGKVI